MPMTGFSYMDTDRSAINRVSTAKFFNWNNWYYTPESIYGTDAYARYWNEMNVVPQVDHMLTTYGGAETENFWQVNASQMNMQITHTLGANGNIVETTFKYMNDNINRGAFDIVIPVTVKYAWGDITTTGNWMSTTKMGKLYNPNMLYVRVHFSATVGN
jgi:hypothetical protein